MKKRICVIASGGTISSVATTAEGFPVPSHSGEQLVGGNSGLRQLADIQVEDFSRVLSSQLTVPQIHQLARRIRQVLEDSHSIDGIVVTHGTGAMEESAWMADLVVDDPRPVVFTGAMRSASDHYTDGPFNLFQAVRVAVSEEARHRGVMIVMNGQIHSARDAIKTHTTGTDTFQSREFGPLGYAYPDRIVFMRKLEHRLTVSTESPEFGVDLVKFVVGMDDRYLRCSTDAGARGIVIEGSGLGNLNDDVMKGVDYALARGVIIVVCSRSPEGRVFPAYGTKTGAKALLDKGCLLASLPGQKVRILLMMLLGTGLSFREMQVILDP